MPVLRYGDMEFGDKELPDKELPDWMLRYVVDDRTWTHRTRRGAERRCERLWRDMDTPARERSDIGIYRRGRFAFVVHARRFETLGGDETPRAFRAP